MQNPKNDIEGVINKVIAASSPDLQKRAVQRYYTEDAGFRSPIFHIAPGRQSREDALAIYQCLQMVSPSNKFKATTTIFDESAETIIVEGDLTLHMRYSFVKPQPAKVLIKFKLDNHSGTHRICSQEYYYHPDQFANMIFPPIAPLVTLGLSVSAYVSAFSAKFAQVFGIWRVSDTGKTRANGGHKAGSKGLGVGDSQSSDDSRSGLKPVNGKQRRRNGGSGHHNPQPE